MPPEHDPLDAAWDAVPTRPEPVSPRPRRVQPHGEAPVAKANGAQPSQARPATAIAERLAPHNVEAERSVLGSILIDDRALERVIGILTPASFYRAAHAEIYAAMLTLAATATPIDLITLGDELRRTDRMERIGGPAELAALMSSVPTAVHVEHYARIVAMKSLARRAIEGAGRIAAIGYEDANDPDELLSRLQAVTDTIAGSWTLAEPLPTPLRLDEVAEPVEPDAWLIEGLVRPATTVMLAGPPGTAKSWAVRQLALTAGAGLAYFLDRYGVGRPMHVLVIDEDNGSDEEWRREESLLAHLGIERVDVNTVYRVSLAGVRLDQERWQKWLRSVVEALRIDLLILDPVSEMHDGKELREEPGFRALLDFLKRLKVECPSAATIVVHHTRKLPSSERQAHRGLEDARGQWGQTPDVIVTMSPLGERRVKWETHKRVPAGSLVLEQIAKGEPGEGGLRLIADEAVMKNQAMTNDGAVLDAIRGGFDHFTDIQMAIGMPPGTLSGVLSRLMRAGLVQRDGRGKGAVYAAPEED